MHTRVGGGLDDIASPGPAAYTPHDEKAKRAAPCYSMAGRHESSTQGDSPGPGTYSVKARPTSAAKTMAGRLPDGSGTSASPGPAAYKPHDEKAKRAAPCYSMAGRHLQKGDVASPG